MLKQEQTQFIDVAYTKDEMLEKLQEMRQSPEIVDRNTIYLLSKNVNEFHALNRDSQIKIITSHGVRSFVKTLLWKETPIERTLRKMELPPIERKKYQAIVNGGGIVIVSGSDPFNDREWTGHTLTKWITNQSNSSNLIDWNIKNIRQVPFEQETVQHFPEMDVAGEFGQANSVKDGDTIPLLDHQRYVRHPKTKALCIYQGPHK